MIPTVILIAFLIARWWAVAVGVVLWPLALVIWGDPDITLAGL